MCFVREGLRLCVGARVCVCTWRVVVSTYQSSLPAPFRPTLGEPTTFENAPASPMGGLVLVSHTHAHMYIHECTHTHKYPHPCMNTTHSHTQQHTHPHAHTTLSKDSFLSFRNWNASLLEKQLGQWYNELHTTRISTGALADTPHPHGHLHQKYT